MRYMLLVLLLTCYAGASIPLTPLMTTSFLPRCRVTDYGLVGQPLEVTTYETTAGGLTQSERLTFNPQGQLLVKCITNSTGEGVVTTYLWEGDRLIEERCNATVMRYRYGEGPNPTSVLQLVHGVPASQTVYTYTADGRPGSALTTSPPSGPVISAIRYSYRDTVCTISSVSGGRRDERRITRDPQGRIIRDNTIGGIELQYAYVGKTATVLRVTRSCDGETATSVYDYVYHATGNWCDCRVTSGPDAGYCAWRTVD